MDSERFDAMTRTFVASHSRRRALGALCGGALGLHAVADVAAKHHHKGKHKAPGTTCSGLS